MSRKKTLRLLFVADPLERFNPERETTLWIMREAQRRGYEIYATTPEALSAKTRDVYGTCLKLKILPPGKLPWYQILLSQRREVKSFDAVLLRKDPPFDRAYLHHLQLLDLISSEVYMMNHPRGILTMGEKFFPLFYPGLSPETLVSCDENEILNFIARHPKGSILKPIGSSGGRGVYWIQGDKSPNLKVLLEDATQEFRRYVILQPYLPEVKRGDKRILLLGKHTLGAFLRKPAAGEHRANLHAGGSLHPTKVSSSEAKIVAALGPELRRLGLDLVGLDLIGPYLTEVNITSPMGLAELSKTGHPEASAQVLDFIEKRIQ